MVALGGGAILSRKVRQALADHLPVWCDVEEGVAVGQGILWVEATASSRPGSVLAVSRSAGRCTSRWRGRSSRRRRGTQRAPQRRGSRQCSRLLRSGWSGRIGERRLPSGGGQAAIGLLMGRPRSCPATCRLAPSASRTPRPSVITRGCSPAVRRPSRSRGPSRRRRSRRPSASCAGSPMRACGGTTACSPSGAG